ncbi:MAG: calcium-binding protein, partial [Pandoraea sp.]
MDTKQQAASGNHALIVPVTHGQIIDIPVQASVVSRYYVQGVDVVLELKSGERVVLAGAGPEAFDSAHPLQVTFEHGAPTLLKSHLLPSMGQVVVADAVKTLVPQDASKDAANAANAAKLAHTEKALAQTQKALESTKQTLAETKQELDQSQKATASAEPTPPATPAIGELLKAGNGNEQGEGNPDEVHLRKFDAQEPPQIVPPAGRTGSPPSDPGSPQVIHVGKVTMNVVLLASTDTVESGNTIYGPYGAPGANKDSTPPAQTAIATVQVPEGKTFIANQGDGGTFTKIMHLTMTGAGEPKSLTLSGVPADWTIPGATRNADGTYTIDLAKFASANGENQYDIPVTYPMVAVDPNAVIHSSNQLTFTMVVDQGGDLVTVDWVQTVVVKDVTPGSADDGLYVDPHTGESTLVLPAQGIGYNIVAGGNDTIVGGLNDDTIVSGTGGNNIDGNGGVNTVSYANAKAGVVVDLGAGTVTGGGVAADTVKHIQKVIGSDFGDTIIGTTDTVGITGGAGNDTIKPGGALNVAIDGGGGVDTLSFEGTTGDVVANLKNGVFSGAGGNGTVVNVENLIGGDGNDTLTGTTNTTSIKGGGGNDTFDPGGATNVVIEGGAGGNNTLSFAGTKGDVTANLKTGEFSGADGNGRVSNVQNLIGGDGNDFLTGTTDTKSMTGGAGDDTFDPGGAINVAINGGGGNNTLSFAGTAGDVIANLKAGEFSGGDGSGTVVNVQNLIGGDGNDTLTGTT